MMAGWKGKIHMNKAITAYRTYMKEVDRLVQFVMAELKNNPTAIIDDFEFWDDSTPEIQILMVKNNATGEVLKMTDPDGLFLWEDILDRVVQYWG